MTGVIGGTIVGLLGGMDNILHVLIFLVGVDFLTGLAKAWKLKEVSSEVGFEGLLKKVLIFVVIAVTVEAQKIVGNSIPLREIVIMFYVANEGISFLENISVFLPLPDKLKEVFQQIRNDTENKDQGGNK
ncbi:TPA: phage holin family protein [Enterococcus faecium]|uniref:phage holin family protein n=2 Tax=Enterococcus TaxID=1350 RepID=UPI0003529708|nr:phage holin family protein [Enterococcus faecium]EPI11468.1 toxin secretion/phage lysis holin [Enterococcus faecium SD3B-2]EGP4844194.1 phage holin family protein [Enterococcus faecium]EGP4920186.1 phage holin family protein [Enterococcus faecium]EGP5304832.1 holin [Enterococcus faecium]EGP5327608.1 holin [Enterococcus faecium]